jgi:hypothetical protein
MALSTDFPLGAPGHPQIHKDCGYLVEILAADGA